MRTILKGVLREASGASVRITALCDPDADSHQALRAESGHDFESVASDQALVRHPDVDWVFIGSWNNFHAQQAIVALEAGKHVFCEKPLATTFEDCLAIREAVRKSGRVFAFGLVLRYSPHYQKVRQLIESGVVGEIVSFEFNETLGFNHGGYIFGNWRRKTANAGSHLLEKCCHDLDLANWIIGRLPSRVASFGGKDFFLPSNEHHVARLGPDAKGNAAYSGWPDPHRVNPFSDGADIVDNQVAILQYDGGVRATFHTNCHAAIQERRFYICGTEGALRADAISGIIEWQRMGHGSKIERFQSGHTDGHAGADEVMARELVKTMVKGQKLLASVEDGIRACVVAFAIDEAMRENKVVDLKPWWDAADTLEESIRS